MPKIDFYLLTDASELAVLRIVCRLVEKAYKNQHRVYIHSATAQQAKHIDELLWTYRDDSFLPHHLVGEGPKPPPPIIIGFEAIPDYGRDILINLQATVPEAAGRFNRIIELVASDPGQKASARERYRWYRQEGHPITTHSLKPVEA